MLVTVLKKNPYLGNAVLSGSSLFGGEESYSTITKAIRKTVKTNEGRLFLGYLLRLGGNSSEAEKIFQKLVPVIPEAGLLVP